MSTLFKNISWSAYLEMCALLTIIYYAYIGWKHYRPELDKLIDRLKGNRRGNSRLPVALQYPEKIETGQQEALTASNNRQLSFTGAANDLASTLTGCIETAATEPYTPAQLISKLRQILNDYPDVAATTDREKINVLVVRECEKTGTALLNESEVDTWWSA